MLLYDDISEIVENVIMSQMELNACRSLLCFLFPYKYQSSSNDCSDAMDEILFNSNGDYHVTAYDLPYIKACTKLIKFESTDEGAYPILFAKLDGSKIELDYSACSLIKIFSCIYKQSFLMVFVSDECIAFGTVRSLEPIEDNFCLSNWFFSSDFQTKISFTEETDSLFDVIGWIKSNSKLERTRRKPEDKKHNKQVKRLTNKSWYDGYFEFDLDYIHALLETEYYTGISTERQRNDYYTLFDDQTEDDFDDVRICGDQDSDSDDYTYDDIASEISNVGNSTYFDNLDAYSDILESTDRNQISNSSHDISETIDPDENNDIPEHILNDPEKLLKYLSSRKNGNKLEHSETTIGNDDMTEGVQLTIDDFCDLQNKELPNITFPEEKSYEEIDKDDNKKDKSIKEHLNSENAIQTGKIVDENTKMISHFELISLVNVHSETIFRYIREKNIIPDRVVQKGSRSIYYFSDDNVQSIIKKFGWHIISESNKRRIFLQMIDRMTMSFSYKPVFIKAFFANAKDGKASMSKIVDYFRNFYESRRKAGMFVEKSNSIFSRSAYTDKEVKKLILIYPYKRFAEMQIFTYSKLFGIVSMDPKVWSSLHPSEILEICNICDEHIEKYYSRFK